MTTRGRIRARPAADPGKEDDDTGQDTGTTDDSTDDDTDNEQTTKIQGGQTHSLTASANSLADATPVLETAATSVLTHARLAGIADTASTPYTLWSGIALLVAGVGTVTGVAAYKKKRSAPAKR